MTTTRTCPGPDVLRQLLHGLLSAEEAAEFETHLEVCNRCATVVEALPRDNSLVGLMRSAKRGAPPAVQPDVDSLIARLLALPSPRPARSGAFAFFGVWAAAATVSCILPRIRRSVGWSR